MGLRKVWVEAIAGALYQRIGDCALGTHLATCLWRMVCSQCKQMLAWTKKAEKHEPPHFYLWQLEASSSHVERQGKDHWLKNRTEAAQQWHRFMKKTTQGTMWPLHSRRLGSWVAFFGSLRLSAWRGPFGYSIYLVGCSIYLVEYLICLVRLRLCCGLGAQHAFACGPTKDGVQVLRTARGTKGMQKVQQTSQFGHRTRAAYTHLPLYGQVTSLSNEWPKPDGGSNTWVKVQKLRSWKACRFATYFKARPTAMPAVSTSQACSVCTIQPWACHPGISDLLLWARHLLWLWPFALGLLL